MVEASIISKYGLDLTLPTETKKSSSVSVARNGKLGLVVPVAVGLAGFLGMLWML